MPQAHSLMNKQVLRPAALASSQCKARTGSQKPGVFSLALKSRSRAVTLGRVIRAEAQVEATEAEKEAWERRKLESQEAEAHVSPIPQDEWKWTLNWDYITPQLAVGSCPRSPSDIDRLADEANITAIVNLQSDLCFEALKIPFSSLRERAVERGVWLVRVPVRDFDHGDQAMMLPEAVRVVNLLIANGHRVYVHCTAGINRATLTAVAYLYFIQGLRRDEALAMVTNSRKIANPYMDCLSEAKRRLLDGRNEEVTFLATEMYEQRASGKHNGSPSSDWSAAQTTAIARTFRKYLEVDQGLLDMERDLLTHALQHKPSGTPEVEEQAEEQQVVQEGTSPAEAHTATVTTTVVVTVSSNTDSPAVKADVSELLASEEAQQVRQQLDAILEESKQLSEALAQWQAAKEAADLQVTRLRDRLAEPPAVTTNGKPAGTNGVATAGAVSTNGVAVHHEVIEESVVPGEGEIRDSNGAAIEEEYADSGEMECDVITRQCSSTGGD